MYFMSQPTRAAWIEISNSGNVGNFKESRSPLGLRGLKLRNKPVAVAGDRRSPLGLRGLKYAFVAEQTKLLEVAAHSGCVD